MLLLDNRAIWKIEKLYSEKGNKEYISNVDYFTNIVSSLITNSSVIFEVSEDSSYWYIVFNGGY